MTILAADIGGTKTSLALCGQNEEGIHIIADDKFASASFEGLDAIIERFLEEKSEKIDRACFGIPGQVTGEIIKLANLPTQL